MTHCSERLHSPERDVLIDEDIHRE
jgi:hypothetical protein